MPKRPKVPCAYPGCPELVEQGYCEMHKKKRDQEYNKYGRDEFTKFFYKSKEWIILRAQQLKLQPFCEECLKQGKVKRAKIVDHIIPIKQGGAKLDLANLQSLCWSCHSRKSVEEGSRFGKKF